MKLFGYWRSTATWRVRIGLDLKKIPYEYTAVDLRKDGGEQHRDEYRELNPMRQVPLLEVARDGKGVLRLTQSIAILEYLEERFPAPSLLPGDSITRARARQIAEIVNAGIQPLQNLAVQQWVKHQLHGDEKAWVRHWVSKGLGALEALLLESSGRYSVGDALSIADLYVVPELYFARSFQMDLSPYPTLLRVEAACLEIEAFVTAHADSQPDAAK